MASATLKPRNDHLGYLLGAVMAGVLGFVVLSAGGADKTSVAPREQLFARTVLFSDRSDGGIAISDATTGKVLGEIAPGEGGFVRGALRGFTRERRLENPGVESPLRIAALQGGAIILEDPVSGRWTDLRAFGETNLRSFADILFKKEEGP